jgi:hypothetical protein
MINLLSNFIVLCFIKARIYHYGNNFKWISILSKTTINIIQNNMDSKILNNNMVNKLPNNNMDIKYLKKINLVNKEL